MQVESPGKRFKAALLAEQPLQIVGVINACAALLAKQAGFQVLYLSGAGVSNAAFGLPDLSLTTLTEVVEETRRITGVVDLPLLVDGDTGFGSKLNIERAVHALIKAGAAGMTLEDQTWPKRCGQLPGKQLVSCEEMVERIRIAVAAKKSPKVANRDADFVIMARTDALANEGLEQSLKRAVAYVKAGADMIFAEAVEDLSQYQKFVEAVSAPVLANITEFGKTPMFSTDQLKTVGVQMALYPLSAFRAMNKAAEKVYQSIRKSGTQESLLSEMQTRKELYDLLQYETYKD